MKPAYFAADIAAAEARAHVALGEGVLMRRAAFGLATTGARLLSDFAGGVYGSTVVLLVGTGNNGGDGLLAGAWLAQRGARVLAVPTGESMHPEGLRDLLAAGGIVVAADQSARAIASADLVIDAIVGIGGRGGLRESVAAIAQQCAETPALVVACDIPSGVDADTGAVVGEAVSADVTVTFGALKPGLVVMPGAVRAGVIELIDIGLSAWLMQAQPLLVVQANDVAPLVAGPEPDDHKYSRGVVTIDAGSRKYPGAGVLVTGAARYGGAGLVQHTSSDCVPIEVRYPDVVLGEPVTDQRVTALVTGPGLDADCPSLDRLNCPHPLVADAQALRRIATDPGSAEAVRQRATRGLITVLTPHEGEFASLMPEASGDLLQQVRAAADAWNCVVLLKGATTLVAAPTGDVLVVPFAPSDLATAGSGDVLAGLLGSMLAAEEARLRKRGSAVTMEGAAKVAAGAAWLHALAARVACGDLGGPITADDLITALPKAIAAVRAGEEFR